MIPLRTLAEIEAQIDQFDPLRYSKTRNYTDGGVSYLSPYLSRGLISVREVYERLRNKGYSLYELEAFVMELCWREHAQRIWQHHNPQKELRTTQHWVSNETQLPTAVIAANTGITAIDTALIKLKETGYMHNHARMYLAALVCNHYGCHWRTAAKWLFGQLCDADAASNHLSWQWVCGANAPKVYYANQENINKYTRSQQRDTFLDTSYENLPDVRINVDWTTPAYPFLPNVTEKIIVDAKLPTCIYTPYHLDPKWRAASAANRILFWDLAHWQDYPFSEKIYHWINALAARNIPSLQIYVGRWEDLALHLNLQQTFTKEHPQTTPYHIQQDPRGWLYPDFDQQPGSFFSFWKKVQKHLKNEK
ncbi:MAG: FAD-binding domain-containing protein [Flavobacteriales bacterium]